MRDYSLSTKFIYKGYDLMFFKKILINMEYIFKKRYSLLIMAKFVIIFNVFHIDFESIYKINWYKLSILGH